MSWLTSKGRVEGIARQVVKTEEKYGAVVVSKAVEAWNAEYQFVEGDENLRKLVKAVELQIPVIKNEKNIPDVGKLGYLRFGVAVASGTIDADLDGPLTT